MARVQTVRFAPLAIGLALAAGLLVFSAPAAAAVEIGDHGFTVTNSASVEASADEVWAALIEPARYWSPDHSHSGDAAHFSLEPRAGGCFCETWDGGSVEHMRVVMVMPGSTLRLSGGLGPLQSEGLAGSLTWQIAAQDDGGVTISQLYVVGGQLHAFDAETIAPAVDGVLREQLERLAALFAESD